MKKRGIGRSELARRSSTFPATISQLLTETNQNPSLELIEKIAAGLGISVSELFFVDGKPPDHDVEECLRRVVEEFERRKPQN